MSGFNNPSGWGKNMDRPEHLKTYDGFLKFSKWATLICVAVVGFLILFVFRGGGH